MRKTFIILIYAVLICGTSFLSFADDINLIPRKSLFTGEQRNVFKLSPDGKRLYFSSSLSNSVYLCETSRPDKISEIKMMNGTIAWEPVSTGLVTIVHDSADKIYIVNNSGKIENTELFDNAGIITIVTKQRLNNDVLIISVNSPDLGKAGIYSWDVKTKTVKKLYRSMPGVLPYFDAKLNLIAGNTGNDLGGNTISIYNKSDNNWTELLKHPFAEDMFIGGFSRVISVSDDGNKVWFTSNAFSDKTKLFTYDIKLKQIDTVAENVHSDLLPFGVSIDLDGNVTSIVGLYAKTERLIIDKNYQEDFDFLKNSIKGDVSYGGQSQDGSKWLIREFTGGPAKYYLYDRTAKNLKYLINDYPELNDYSLASRKAFSVKVRDGVELPVHVYLPVGSDKNGDGIPDRPLPTVLYVHGGPWAGVTHWNQYFHWRSFQLLANRGYAVINCDFRGTTGLGKVIIAKSYKTWGSDMTNDKADIAEWSIKNNIAKKDKIGIWGWSYGGYAAFAGAAFYPDLYACAISMYGISDLESFGRIDFANNDFWKERVGNTFDSNEVKMLRKFSPINYIDKIKAPMLLTTGSKDERIPQSQMDSMATVLKNAGKEVVYFYYPEEVHDYRSPKSWMSFWAVAEQFLAEKIGGRYEKKNKDVEESDMVVVEGEKFVEGMD